MAKTVKHLPTMWETRLQSLAWEDSLEKEMATHCSVLAWKIPWMEEPGRLTVHGKKSDTIEQLDFHFPVLLAGKSQGQRSLEGYMGSQESDMT